MVKKNYNTIVLTAHGSINKTEIIKAPANLLTSCKFGEVYSSNHLTFNDLNKENLSDIDILGKTEQ